MIFVFQVSVKNRGKVSLAIHGFRAECLACIYIQNFETATQTVHKFENKALCKPANAFFDCNALLSLNTSTAMIMKRKRKTPSQPTEVATFLPCSPNPYIPPSPHSSRPHLWVLHLWFQCRSRWCHRTRESTGCSHFLCISQLPSGLHPSTVQTQKSGSVSKGKKQLHSHCYLVQQQ